MAVRGVESSLNDPKYVKALETQIEEILNRQDSVESKVDATSRAPRTVNDTPDVDISGTALPDGGVNPTRRFTPAAPAGLNAVAVIDFDNGQAFTSISIGYERVTNALAGDPITIARHELQGRGPLAEWSTLTSSGGTATVVNYFPLPTGQDWEFRMRAVSAQGITGPYSEILQVTLPADTTPPPIPSKPFLSARLGTVSVVWDGLTNTGVTMPSDFARVDVQQSSDDTTFTTVGSIRTSGGSSAYIVTGLPYDDTFYFRFVAVDNSGNVSPAGASDSVVVVPLVDTDAIGLIIDGANIVPGSINAAEKIIGETITGALIQGLTIKAGHLDSNSVTADKVLAGSITGIKIAANTITTNNMFIGDYQNLAPIPSSPDWSAAGAWSVVPYAASATGDAFSMLGNQGSGNNDREGASYDTIPGEQFVLEATVNYTGTTANNGNLLAGAHWFNSAGASLSWSNNVLASATASNLRVTKTVTAPANAAKVRFWIGRSAPTGTGLSTSSVGLWNYSLRRMTTGSLIVDGAIDGKTITGAIIRTGTANQRVQIDSTGLRAFNSAGTAVTTISASTGQITALGSFATGTTGTYIKMGADTLQFYNPQNPATPGIITINNSGAPIYADRLIITPRDDDGTSGERWTFIRGELFTIPNGQAAGPNFKMPITLSGTGSIANVPANTGLSTTVTFPVGAFTDTPRVVVSFGPNAAYWGGGPAVSVWSVNSTTAVIGCSNAGPIARTMTFTWVAVGN